MNKQIKIIAIVLSLLSIGFSQEYYGTDSDGNVILEWATPSSPKPDGFIGKPRTSREIRSNGKELEMVPSFDWVYGCGATSVAMFAGYLDILGGDFENLYDGPTNGGVCPPNNALWGSHECPISATHIGIDGRTARGHVEDYWGIPDPYVAAGVTPHQDDCAADFTGTSQGDNDDGLTKARYYGNGLKFSPDFTSFKGICAGTKEFFESRDVNVSEHFTQLIAGYTGVDEGKGFTYDDFKHYIDLNIPVILHFTDHYMLGIGYFEENGKNMITFRNTWGMDKNGDGTGETEWGGTYSAGTYTGNHFGVIVVVPEKEVGIEDQLAIDGNETIQIEEGSNATFSCSFYDAVPYGDFLDKATFDIALYHENGNFSITNATIDPESPMALYASYSCNIPSIPQGYDWMLDDDNNIIGRIIVSAFDTDGYYHQESKTIKCKINNNNSPNISDFYADDLSGSTPFLTNFHSNNQGGVILNGGYYWNFGDGKTSTFRNPSHIYENVGVYTVTLKVTGKNGDITSTKTSYITVTDDATDMLNFVGSNSWEKVSGSGVLEWQKDMNGLSNNLKITQGADWETTISGKKTIKKFIGSNVERVKMGINLSFPADAVNPATGVYRGNVQLLAKTPSGYWNWVGQFDINSIGVMSIGPDNSILYANYEFLLPNNVVNDLKSSGLDFRLRLSSFNPGDWVILEQIRFEDGDAETNRVLSQSLSEIAIENNTTAASVKSSATSYDSYLDPLVTNIYKIVYIDAIDPADAVSKKFYFIVKQDINKPMYLVEWWSKQPGYNPEVPTQSSSYWRQCWTYLGKE